MTSRIKGISRLDKLLLGAGASSSRARHLLKQQYRSLSKNSENFLQNDVSDINQRTFENNAIFKEVYKDSKPISVPFPRGKFGQRLKAIARIISMNKELGYRRQVFYVTMGGFDTHARQAIDVTNLQKDYAKSIASFFRATQEIGMEKNVTLFTGSDFGRALPENGDGTDHGWGGHHFVVGGAVKGKRIYGQIPPIKLGHAHDAGNGRLVPQVSVEQYAATMGRWFGLSDAELLQALPALENFKTRNLGFMAGTK